MPRREGLAFQDVDENRASQEGGDVQDGAGVARDLAVSCASGAHRMGGVLRAGRGLLCETKFLGLTWIHVEPTSLRSSREMNKTPN